MNLTKQHEAYCYTRAEAAGEEIEKVKDLCNREVRKLQEQRDRLPVDQWFDANYERLESQIEALLFDCDEKVAHLAKIANGWDPDEQDRRDLAYIGRGG